MGSSLTRDDVLKVAVLARLRLTDSDVTDLTVQLGRVLDYVAVLNEVETDDVEPLVHAVEMSNRFRSDEVRESLPRDQALANAPNTDGRSFLVPAILGGG